MLDRTPGRPADREKLRFFGSCHARGHHRGAARHRPDPSRIQARRSAIFIGIDAAILLFVSFPWVFVLLAAFLLFAAPSCVGPAPSVDENAAPDHSWNPNSESAAGRSGKPRTPARLEFLAGDAALSAGDYEDAQHRYETALNLAREARDSESEFLALNQLGVLAERRGNLRDARHLYTQALHLQPSTSAREMDLVTQINLANVCLALGDLEEASGRAESALKSAEAQEYQEGRGLAHRILGEAAWEQGQGPEARFHLARATVFLDRTRHHRACAGARLLLGELSLQEGDPRAAIRELAAARDSFQTVEHWEGEVRALAALARAYESLGDPAVALTFWERAIERAEDRSLSHELRQECLSEALRVAELNNSPQKVEKLNRELDQLNSSAPSTR